MDEQGLKFISTFALSAGCQINSFNKLKKCVDSGNCEAVEKELEKFPALNPFLKTISEVTGLSKYSYEVGEAYWLGNDLINKFKPEHYYILIKYFKEQGVPEFYLEELKNNPPKEFIPIHLFKVLHVDRTGNNTPIEAINQCMVRWGRVTDFNEVEMFLKLNSLKINDNKYDLYILNDRASYDRKLFPEIKVGDIVAVHKNVVVKTLSQREIENLELFTNKYLFQQINS